jgi:hypothetical protein
MYRRFGVRVSFTRFALGEIVRVEDRGIMMVDVSISGLPMVRRDPMVIKGGSFGGRTEEIFGWIFVQRRIRNYTSLKSLS